MDDVRDGIAAWVAKEILPHEAMVRNWLSRRWGASVDVDDVIQEAYCRIAELASVDHIGNGRSYFFKTVKAIIMDGMRRAKVANIRYMTEIDVSDVIDDRPLADRTVEASQELDRVNGLLSKLSLTCRRVIELRRIQGLSQKETARQLGVSESVVENHIVRGLRSVLKAMADQDARAEETKVDAIGRSGSH